MKHQVLLPWPFYGTEGSQITGLASEALDPATHPLYIDGCNYIFLSLKLPSLTLLY